MTRILVTAFAAILVAVVPSLDAQIVAYAPGGAVYADQNGDLTINVGTIDSDVLIRIFDEATCDENTPPALNVGTVTITGAATSNGRLRILVANCDVHLDFDPGGNPLDRLDEGVVNFGHATNGGLIIRHPSDPNNNTLRNASVLALAATGNIAGSIDVGRVFRIQALGITDPQTGAVTGGTISSDITSHRRNYDITGNLAFEPIELCAIKVVVAGNAITGQIEAMGLITPGDPDTYSSIGMVAVGPWEGAAGITGNILAPHGRIVRVFSTGPIGTPSAPSVITAANGIKEIRTGIASQHTVLERDLHVQIDAAVNPTASGDAFRDGHIGHIFTNGSIGGSIQAANLSWDGSTGQLGGIIARGPITASISIDNNLSDSNIIGSSITGGVTIGWMAQGCIVATGIDQTDPNAGHINALQIGFGSVNALYEYYFRPGLVGTYCLPIRVEDVQDWYGFPGCFSGGAYDSVVHATASIGSVRLAAMSQVWGRDGLDEIVVKSEVPRVEAPVIGTLEIGDMRAGVVWSGLLEYDNGDIDNIPANDFAAIGSMDIGCVGPGADIWFSGCERAVIQRDLFGQMHLPLLDVGETIWIGDRLGDGPPVNTVSDVENYCACGNQEEEDECFYTQGTHIEASPRQPGYAAVGGIHIRQHYGLKGQIIINGNNTTVAEDTGWEGTVAVGPGFGDWIELKPGLSQPYFAPHYELPSSELGGGAVGLAPFAFYPTDCVPVDGDMLNAIPWTAFMDAGATPVVPVWYGPVKLPPIDEEDDYAIGDLLMLECLVPGDPCNWYDLTGLFSFAFRPSDNPRAIGIRRGDNVVPKDGVWRLSWLDQDNLRLLCEDVTGHPQVGNFAEGCTEGLGVYTFRVDADCNGNDTPDSIDIIDGGVDEFDIPLLDQDENGILDECEIEPTCAADWDGNGWIEVLDLFEFLTDWFANNCDALCFGLGPSPCPSPNGECGVPAIFRFLSEWFALPPGPCVE